jgi:tetratricopeptide (TPR) repeat protein
MRKATFLSLLTILFFCLPEKKANAQSADSTAYNIAVENYSNWHFDKAQYWFTQSILSGYKVADSYMLRGSAKSLIGDYQGAKADLDSAYKIDPANTDIFLYYARVYLFEKKFDEGLSAIDRAIAGDSTDAHYFDCKGSLYMNKGDYKLALINANRAIKLDYNLNYINNRGLIKQKAGKYNEAIADFEIVLKAAPEDPVTLTNVATCYYKLKTYQKALAICNQVLDKQPNIPYTLATRGEILFATGEKEKACLDFKKLYSLDENGGLPYLNKYCK